MGEYLAKFYISINNIMLTSSMKTNSILQCSVALFFIIPIVSQCASASTQNAISTTAISGETKEYNVSFYCHGYSFNGSITNQKLPVICFVKDVNLSAFFAAPFGLFINKFKIWNDTGLLDDFTVDHCGFGAKNFTGVIIHRRCLFGYAWFVYGHCDIFRENEPYTLNL
jgi:hypothetical protein